MSSTPDSLYYTPQVNALVTECKANADGAAYVVPFTMDTASEIGVQTRRHFRSPVPGMPLESAGFEMRQALYVCAHDVVHSIEFCKTIDGVYFIDGVTRPLTVSNALMGLPMSWLP